MMQSQKRHIEGFTLSELLLSIAIVLVLCAIAIPSILAVQNNMRIFELDNAAESIANAAQAHMTAKKSGGTWSELIKEDGQYRSEFPKATSSDGSDSLRYMTANTAREKGILTGLSVDESVYENSYIIEFDASTASVTRVFYTDGKTGFFGTAQPKDSELLQYYNSFGSQSDSKARRISNDCGIMVGYFEGTAAGATETKALDNPVIWMDSAGKLVVQDKNLTDEVGQTWDTEVAVSVTAKDAEAPMFTISGLSSNYAQCTIEAKGSDGTVAKTTCTKAEMQNIIQMTTKATTSTKSDAYAIDLNQLVASMAGSADSQRAALYTILSEFTPKQDLQVTAKVTIPESKKMGYVPATAKANVQWPLKEAKIYLYTTNPTNAKANTPSHIEGAYTAPQTGLDGEDVLGLWTNVDDITFPVKTSSSTLTAENPESGYQRYSGGYATLADAVGKQAKLEAKAGSYTSTTTETTHQYQIYEIWLNISNEEAEEGSTASTSGFQRVGYLNENEWTWETTGTAGEWGQIFKDCVTLSGNQAGKTDYTTMTVDSQALYNSLPVSENSSGYMIYLRTTPKLEEVGTWFSDNMNSGYKFATSVGTNTTGSRGTNYGYTIRKPFENEFGAPTTVALWQYTKSAGTSIRLSNNKGFPAEGNIRVYYTATPALAWGDGAYIDDNIYNALPSATLWLYLKNGSQYEQQRMALVRPALVAEGSENYHLIASPTADFEMPYSDSNPTINGTTYHFKGHDELFYRVFEYCNAEGTALDGYDVAYVPYFNQKSADPVAGYTTEAGQKFSGWEVWSGSTQVKDSNGNALVLPAGANIADYDSLLPLGSIQLRAIVSNDQSQYTGLVYIGFDAAGNKIAYGYQSGDSGVSTFEIEEVKNPKEPLEVGSYYLFGVVGGEVRDYTITQNGSTTTYPVDSDDKSGITVHVGGASHRAWKIDVSDVTAQYVSVNYNFWYKYESGGKTAQPSRTYYINPNFAYAVTADASLARTWGTASSPWQVELPKQFIGALNNSAQVAYCTNHFKQVRDIDFTNTKYSGLQQIFSGTYDGDNKHIYGAENIMGSLTYTTTEDGQTNGLFPRTKKATLKNIQVVLGTTTTTSDQSPTITYANTSSEKPVIFFGALVGFANEGSISGCSVSSANGSTAQINLHSLRSEIPSRSDCYNAAGALAGRTVAVSVSNCSASNISFSLKTLSGTWNSEKSRNYFGGLLGVSDIGAFSNAARPLSNLSVDNVSLCVEQSTLPASRTIALGGVAGRVYAGTATFTIDSSWNWTAKNNAITVDLGLDRAGVSKNLSVGSAIGVMSGSGDTTSSTCSGFDTAGCTFANLNAGTTTYRRNLSEDGPLCGPIPLTDATYEEAGLLYVSSSNGDSSWSSSGYITGTDTSRSQTVTRTSGAGTLEAGSYYLLMPATSERKPEGSSTLSVEPIAGTYAIEGGASEEGASEGYEMYKLAPTESSANQYEVVQITVSGAYDTRTTHTYYVNFAFANAVSTDEASAQAWGTSEETAWQVAEPQQFPGALPEAMQTSARMDDYFEQTADLSFGELSGPYTGFKTAFKGVYNGGGHSITQFFEACSTYEKDNKQIYTGLFPCVDGGTIKNLTLQVSANGSDMTVAMPAETSQDETGITGIGCVAGAAKNNATIEYCTVKGTESTAPVQITFTNVPDATPQVGVVVGYASSGSSVVGCSADSVAMSIKCTTGIKRSNQYLNFGGVVGSTQVNEGGSITNASNAEVVLSRNGAHNIQFATNTNVVSRWIRVGGVVGAMGAKTTLTDAVGDSTRCNKTQAKDILAVLVAEQEEKRIKDTIGGLVGRMVAGTTDATCITIGLENPSTMYENVQYRIGNGTETSATKWWGNDNSGDATPGVFKPSLTEVANASETSGDTAVTSLEKESSLENTKDESTLLGDGTTNPNDSTDSTNPTDPADPAGPSQGTDGKTDGEVTEPDKTPSANTGNTTTQPDTSANEKTDTRALSKSAPALPQALLSQVTLSQAVMPQATPALPQVAIASRASVFPQGTTTLRLLEKQVCFVRGGVVGAA